MNSKEMSERETARKAAEPARRAQMEQQRLDPVIAATARQQSLLGQAGGFLGLPAATVFNVLRGIWTTSKGQEPLTDQEMRQGVALVAKYELDPFAREIYVTRDNKGNPMVIIGIDGWVKILDRTDHYDGMEQECLWKGDATDPVNCYAVITRIFSTKRSKPATYLAYRTEYAQVAGFMNNKIPLHMLRIFSLRHAARLFTPLGGCVSEEEARARSEPADETVPAKSLDDLTERLTEPVKLPSQLEEVTDGPAAAARLEALKQRAYDAGRRQAEPSKLVESVQALVDPYPTPKQQDANCESLAAMLADADEPVEVVRIHDDIAEALKTHFISDTQYAELGELEKAATERVSK